MVELGDPAPARSPLGFTTTRQDWSAPAAPKVSRRSISWVTAVAVLVTAALTAVLSVLSYQLNRHNEHHLLELQVEQTATVLQTILPAVETPMASALEIASAHHGAPSAFRSYMSSYVGTSPKPFAGAALYHVQGSGFRQLASVGSPLVLPTTSLDVQQTVLANTHPGTVTMSGPFGVTTPHGRVGYTYAASGLVVYAESRLPAHRRVVIKPPSPFVDLRFALYIGRVPSEHSLLETNSDRLPVPGDTAMASVAFGASRLTLVASSDRQLTGGLSGSLWWIVIIVGVVLAALIATTTQWLVRRRQQAEGLTATTELQLAQQRTLAQMVQRALLPESIPDPPGFAAQARYVPGVAGVDIGGDWYDLIPLDERRAFFVIGDVSGRGVQAGTTMASLRFAIRAFVSEGHGPAEVLRHLTALLDVAHGGQFATILCGVLDGAGCRLTAANAGHLPPLLLDRAGSEYLEIPAGPPIGVRSAGSYREVTVPLPSEGTLFTFTDGLVERPGETLDESLDRLRSALHGAASLAEVFEQVVPLLSAGSRDDIAVLGVQWPN